MAEKHKYIPYVQTTQSSTVVNRDGTEYKSVSGGSGGGGVVVDAETKNYLDANMATVRAQNDARFAEVLAGISRVDHTVSHLAPPMTWQQLALTFASVGLVLIGVVFAALSYASDRFDGGISASGLLDEFAQLQANRDIAQDAKADQILNLLKELAARPSSTSP